MSAPDVAPPEHDARTGKPRGKGPQFDVAVIARVLDLTERRVQQLVESRWISRSKRGKYYLLDAVHGYVRYLRWKARVARGRLTGGMGGRGNKAPT